MGFWVRTLIAYLLAGVKYTSCDWCICALTNVKVLANLSSSGNDLHTLHFSILFLKLKYLFYEERDFLILSLVLNYISNNNAASTNKYSTDILGWFEYTCTREEWVEGELLEEVASLKEADGRRRGRIIGSSCTEETKRRARSRYHRTQTTAGPVCFTQ